MLYVLAGALTKEKEKENKKLLGSLSGNLSFVDEDKFTEELFLEPLYNENLFSQKEIFYVRNSLKKILTLESSEIKKLVDSKHIFIFDEDASTKEISKKIQKIGGIYIETEAVTKKVVLNTPNVFLLTDFIFERNKKDAWIYYQKIKNEDPYKLVGMLFWAFKTLAIIKDGKDEAQIVKPFVKSKVQKNIHRWGTEDISRGLTYMLDFFHVYRFDEEGLRIKIEEFLLEYL